MIKNVRRDNAAKKRSKPKPEWVQAFLIVLLHEVAILKQQLTGKPHTPEITLTLDDLKRFEALKGGNKTSLTFDKVAETVTLTAPKVKLPEVPKIIHNKELVGPN